MKTPARSFTMLENIMPTYDIRDAHDIWVPGPPKVAYAVIKTTTAREVRLFGPLMRIRSIVDRVIRKAPQIESTRPLLDEFVRGGWSILGEESEREVVLGAIGRFWRLTDNHPVKGIDSTQTFREFSQPRYAKVAVSFRVVPERSGCRIVTETRVKGTSQRGTQLFRVYWLLIRLGSAALRRSWLAAIRRRSERTQ